MGGPDVGGDPGTVASGGDMLASAAVSVHGMGAGVSQVGRQGGGAGDARIEAALSRDAAAAGATVEALHTQIGGAARLAKNAAADLSTAGGR